MGLARGLMGEPFQAKQEQHHGSVFLLYILRMRIFEISDKSLSVFDRSSLGTASRQF
jgi:hypothetical protein